jgi:hypothetical protein
MHEDIRSLGRSKRRLEDNIIMILTIIGWDCVDWNHVAQDRDQWQALVNTIMYLKVP